MDRENDSGFKAIPTMRSVHLSRRPTHVPQFNWFLPLPSRINTHVAGLSSSIQMLLEQGRGQLRPFEQFPHKDTELGWIFKGKEMRSITGKRRTKKRALHCCRSRPKRGLLKLPFLLTASATKRASISPLQRPTFR